MVLACLQTVQYDERNVLSSSSISAWVVVQSGIWQTTKESKDILRKSVKI